MNILFFDVETNGLPLNWKASVADVDNWPRVIELGWQLVDSLTEEVVARRSDLIEPDGWTVPEEEFWTSRGMTTAACMLDGIPIRDAATEFLKALDQVDILVAHNMEFDSKVLGAELLRLQLKSDRRPLKICTKEATTQYCKIPYQPGGKRYPGASYKWPKLEELWGVLFGKSTWEQAHRAGNDVEVLKTCFFECVRRHVIRLPKEEELT